MPLRMIRTVEDVLTKVVLEKGKEVTAWASTSRSGAPTVHRVNHKGTEFQLVEGVEVVEFDNRDERRERERKEKGLDTDKVEFDVRLVKKLLVGDEVLERGHEAKVERVSHTED